MSRLPELHYAGKHLSAGEDRVVMEYERQNPGEASYMVAETLRTTLLAPLAFAQCHLPLILRTLTASSTGEEEDYQRYVYSVPSMQTFACP